MSCARCSWWRDLARLGVHLPLFVVHDIGLLYGAPREQVEIAPRVGADALVARFPGFSELVSRYRSIIAELAQSQAAASARGMKLGDDLVVVVLARIVSALGQKSPLPHPLASDPPP